MGESADSATSTSAEISPHLEAIEATWRSLFDSRTCTPFQSLDWARAWLATIGSGAEVQIVTVGNPIRALLPLVRVRRRGVRILRALGHGQSDYVGPIPGSPGPDVLEEIGRCIRADAGSYDVLDLRGLNCTPGELRGLASGLSGLTTERSYECCPIIDTDQDWEAFLASRTRKFRANLKRTIRRTESLGAVEAGIERVSPRLFGEMIEVERDSWKWEGGFAYLRDEASRNFLEKVLLESKVESETWTCRIDGRLVSFAVVFRNGEVRYYYLPSFRSRFPDTGTFLLARLVRDSCSERVREVDLLQGDERYKTIWATRSREVRQLVSAGRGLRAIGAFSGYRLRWRLAESQKLRSWRKNALLALQAFRRGS